MRPLPLRLTELAPLLLLLGACSTPPSSSPATPPPSSSPSSSAPLVAASSPVAPPAAVDVRVLRVPSVVPVTPGDRVLVFELDLRQRSPEPQRLEQAVVTDAASGQTLLQLAGPSLHDNARFFSAAIGPLKEKDPYLESGQGGIVMLFVTLAEGQAAPAAMSTKLSWVGRSGGRSETTHPVEVSSKLPVVVRPPVPPGLWFCDGATAPTSYHRRATLPLDGSIFLAQRYAIDFELMDEKGRLAKGDATKVENWFGYGRDILAAADGVVTKVRDGVPNSTPPNFPPGIKREDVDGNHVTIRTPDGLFMLYAHMRPGSIKVAVGARVRAGDVLGHLGNSGNSTAPHLHFHVTDREDALAAEGVPFVLDRFVDRGVATEIDVPNGVWNWAPERKNKPAASLLPTLNTVITVAK